MAVYGYLRLAAVLIIAVHLASPYLDIDHVWGTGGFHAIPLAARALLALAVVPFFHRGLAAGAWEGLLGLWRRARRRLSRTALFAGAALAAVPLFWLARLGHLRWGDAYIFANAISHPDVMLTYNWQAPLDVLLHARAWALAHRLRQWDVATTYAVISCLAGGAFVFTALHLARRLGADLSQRALAAALLLSLGSMQLFFGYVESYTIVPVGIAAFLLLGLRYLEGQGRLWQPAAVLALTHAFSPSTLPLSAALLYLGWRRLRGVRGVDRVDAVDRAATGAAPTNAVGRPDRPAVGAGAAPARGSAAAGASVVGAGAVPARGSAAAGASVVGAGPVPARGRVALGVALQVAGPMVLVAALVAAIMTAGGHGVGALLTSDRPGGGDGKWFVPLFETTSRWEHYTMFSWPHVRDLLNQQLLVAPVSLLLALGVAVRFRRQLRRAGPAAAFLAIATGAYLLLTFVWNPDYGGRRDWDLFAPASLPLTALAACLLNRYLSERERRPVAALALALSLMHLIPWVYFNTQPWPWD